MVFQSVLCLLTCLLLLFIQQGTFSPLRFFLNPDYATNASTASGLVNGFATILLTVLLDPRIALLTERALQSESGAESMSKMYGWLMISRLLGTLLAQLLFVPGAYWILWIIELMH